MENLLKKKESDDDDAKCISTATTCDLRQQRGGFDVEYVDVGQTALMQEKIMRMMCDLCAMCVDD